MDSAVLNQNFSFKKMFGLGKSLHRVAGTDELKVNEIKPLRIKGKNILLCRSEDGFYAVNDTCAHRSASLSNGIMVENTIQCLKHGCRYDIKTGKHKYGPGNKNLATYKVFIVDNDIYVEC